MMFLRHEMFARKAFVERLRKRQIGAVIGLLLVLSMAIIAIVKAAGVNYDLGYTDSENPGLTGGNITAVITKTGGTAAVNIKRDETLYIHLEFTLLDEAIASAKEADTWTYDLYNANSSFGVSTVLDVSQPAVIVNDGVVIAKYTISNGVITIVPEKTQEAIDWWNGHTRDVKFGITTKIAINPFLVRTANSAGFALPGTRTDSNPSGNYTNQVFFKVTDVEINSSVYDSYSQKFKTGSDIFAVAEKDGNDYLATYNVDFYTNFMTNDLVATITLDSNQDFVQGGAFEMSGCAWKNCVHDSNASPFDITSYVTLSNNNKTATIDVAGIFSYCDSHSSECKAAHVNYAVNGEMTQWTSLWTSDYNYSDYYIQFKTNLGQTNPAGSGTTYQVDYSISGSSGTITDSDSLSYNAGISGTKTGTCVNGYRRAGSILACKADSEGNTYIDYQIAVGDANTNLSGISIIDKITDNQVLEGDITLTAPDSTITTIQKTNTCTTNDDNDCVISDAVDSNFSSDSVKLFSHAFAAGDVGPWTISYRVKVADRVELEEKNVDSAVDIKTRQDTCTNVWSTAFYGYFSTPVYLEKYKDYTQPAKGLVYWDIFVFGSTGDSSYSDVTITDLLFYDKTKYPNGSIVSSVVSATKYYGGEETVANDYSVSTVDGNLQITIPSLSPETDYRFMIATEADSTFIEDYAGESVELWNSACRNDSVVGEYCTEGGRATILTPSVNEITKTGVQDDYVFAWELDTEYNEYYATHRNGIIWTVTINPHAGSIDNEDPSDYEPYFTDTIPEGLYLTNNDDAGELATPECGADSCDASRDIDQSKYWATINVERIIPSIPTVIEPVVVRSGPGSSASSVAWDVPVTVTDGVIEPINLASLFNDVDCTVPSDSDPRPNCAGVNGAIYEVTYATALADNVYYDLANAHNFTSQAKMQREVDNVLTDAANAVATATYKDTTAINKYDATKTSLDSLNKITYMIKVNETAYTYLNNGEPYDQGATIPYITITDQIANNVELSTAPFSSLNLENSYYLADGELASSTESVICTDENDEIVNDCTTYYDDANRTLAVRVPDGVTRYIWYTVTVTNPALSRDDEFVNTAVFHTGTTDIESTVSKEHNVVLTTGYATSNGILNIKNVDADDFLTAIPGATYKLVQVDYDQSGILGTETVIDLNGADAGTDAMTDAYGRIRILDLCGYATTTSSDCLNGGQLYYWQETSAPSPYTMGDNAKKHYFVLYDKEVITSDTEANRALAQTAADLVKNYTANNVSEISVLQSNYEWTVASRQQAETTVAIEQRITGNQARVEDTFTISIEVSDVDGNPISGTYKAYTYNISDPTDITREDITFTNGLATVTADYGLGILIDQLPVGGRYSITDTNASYIHNFICADLDTYYGCDSATSGSGEFVADNNRGLSYPTVAGAGQHVVITSNNSSAITGITNKKPSLAIAATFGGVVAILGIAVARRLR